MRRKMININYKMAVHLYGLALKQLILYYFAKYIKRNSFEANVYKNTAKMYFEYSLTFLEYAKKFIELPD